MDITRSTFNKRLHFAIKNQHAVSNSTVEWYNTPTFRWA